jgi:hypothetical protein
MNVVVLVEDQLHPMLDPSAVTVFVRDHPQNKIMWMQMGGGGSLQLTATLDFSQFGLDGDQFLSAEAIAPNKMDLVGRATVQFTIDSTGPTIQIKEPVQTAPIGRDTRITAVITDPSGVDPDSAKAVIGGALGNETHTVVLRSIGNDQYSGDFGAQKLGRSYVQAEIAVYARDQLGNEGHTDLEYYVDNTPPKLSLNPPLIRVAKHFDTGWECTAKFDPVGLDTAKEGATVVRNFLLRARVEDFGNSGPGVRFELVSGIDPATVKLAIMPAPVGAPPLVVDTDGDGHCDSFNPLVLPTNGSVSNPKQAILVDLVPLPKGSSPNFPKMDTTNLPFPCNASGTDSPPKALCSLTPDFNYVLTYPDASESVIYSIPPVDLGSVSCLGNLFDAANQSLSGPVCAAVFASDKRGNYSVSAPLHICIQSDANPAACTGQSGQWQAANCTGVFTNHAVVPNSTCIPRNFGVDDKDNPLPIEEVVRLLSL